MIKEHVKTVQEDVKLAMKSNVYLVSMDFSNMANSVYHAIQIAKHA